MVTFSEDEIPLYLEDALSSKVNETREQMVQTTIRADEEVIIERFRDAVEQGYINALTAISAN